MARKDKIFTSAFDFVDERFDLNRGANLLQEGILNLEGVSFSEGQAARLTALRQELLALLEPDATAESDRHRERLVRYMADKMEHGLAELSQYVRLTKTERRDLVGLYERLLDGTLGILRLDLPASGYYHKLQALIMEHFRSLRGFLGRITDHDAFLPAGRRILRLPCFEYSAEFQLKIMGLDPARLREPILDLGCGENGLLAEHLAAQGLTVCGIDRRVKDSPFLIAADWLEFRLEPEHWGTIVSHMAFSNHFVNHLARVNGRPQIYAGRMMEILNSLQSWGSFYYAPGLPFLECFLPQAKYRVAQRRIEPEIRIGPARKDLLGDGLRYSTRITRIGNADLMGGGGDLDGD